MLGSRIFICHQWQPSPEIRQCVSKEDTEEKRKEYWQSYLYVLIYLSFICRHNTLNIDLSAQMEQIRDKCSFLVPGPGSQDHLK